MEIYLNGQPLEFRLETERNLGDVASAVERWLASGGLCLAGLRVDERDVGWGVDPRWSAVELGGVRRLDFTVAPVSERRLAALRTTTQYLELFGAALARKDEKLLGDLAAGYPSMVEGIRTLLSPQPGSDLHASLVALDGLLAGNTPQRIAVWPPETVAAATAAAGVIRDAVSAKTREWDDPRAALAEIRGALERAIAGAAEVSVLLQTGREREAMARVITFSELAQSHLAVVERILETTGEAAPEVGGTTLHVFGEALNGVLQQLLDAFRSRDTVLIGDLLEYEVAPRVRELTLSTAGLERPGSAGAP